MCLSAFVSALGSHEMGCHKLPIIIINIISKAFDCIWHRGFILKVESIGVRSQLLKWFHVYHSAHAVVIKGDNSVEKMIPSGVP